MDFSDHELQLIVAGLECMAVLLGNEEVRSGIADVQLKVIRQRARRVPDEAEVLTLIDRIDHEGPWL